MPINSKTKEVWKPIEGYEGLYEISSFGNVKSLRQNKIMSLVIMPTGYYKVNLVKNNRWKTFRVHRLVATSFLENPKNKNNVNHKDFNKLNNNVENLEWVTHQENVTHAVLGGRFGKTKLYGSKNGRALFNDEQVKDIKEMLKTNSIKQISDVYNCRYNVIWEIKNNITYVNK